MDTLSPLFARFDLTGHEGRRSRCSDDFRTIPRREHVGESIQGGDARTGRPLTGGCRAPNGRGHTSEGGMRAGAGAQAWPRVRARGDGREVDRPMLRNVVRK